MRMGQLRSRHPWSRGTLSQPRCAFLAFAWAGLVNQATASGTAPGAVKRPEKCNQLASGFGAWTKNQTIGPLVPHNTDTPPDT